MVWAVKQGYKTGIFYSWCDCEKQIKGYSGALFRKFKTQVEAEAYLRGEEIKKVTHIESVGINGGMFAVDKFSSADVDALIDDDTCVAYIGGSFQPVNKKFGFGCLIKTKKGIQKYGGCNSNENLMNSTSGELFGAIHAIYQAKALGYKNVVIVHKYDGIGKYARGEWQAKSESAKRFVDFVWKYRQSMGVDFKCIGGIAVEECKAAERLAKAVIANEKYFSADAYFEGLNLALQT